MSVRRRLLCLLLVGLTVGLSSSSLAAATSADDQAARMQARESTFVGQITSDRLAKLDGRCDDAQLKIGAISTLQIEQSRRRNAAYGDLLSQLHRLDGKLTANGIRHDNLRKELAKLDDDWRDFQTNSDNYSAALSDGRSLDCLSNPGDFIVTLVDARQSQIAMLESHDQFVEQLKVVKKELGRLVPLLSSSDVRAVEAS